MKNQAQGNRNGTHTQKIYFLFLFILVPLVCLFTYNLLGSDYVFVSISTLEIFIFIAMVIHSHKGIRTAKFLHYNLDHDCRLDCWHLHLTGPVTADTHHNQDIITFSLCGCVYFRKLPCVQTLPTSEYQLHIKFQCIFSSFPFTGHIFWSIYYRFTSPTSHTETK